MPSLTKPLDETLAVNDGPLTAENAAFLRPSDANLPLEELQARYEEDGYLFIKQVLPRADVLEMRHQYFSHLASTGVLKEGTQPVEGVFNTKKTPEDYPGIGAGHVGGNGWIEDRSLLGLGGYENDYERPINSNRILVS